MPDGHLRKLLLHNSQIHLQEGEEIKKSTDEEIFAVCVGYSVVPAKTRINTMCWQQAHLISQV